MKFFFRIKAEPYNFKTQETRVCDLKVLFLIGYYYLLILVELIFEEKTM